MCFTVGRATKRLREKVWQWSKSFPLVFDGFLKVVQANVFQFIAEKKVALFYWVPLNFGSINIRQAGRAAQAEAEAEYIYM